MLSCIDRVIGEVRMAIAESGRGAWRPMRAGDVPAATAISDEVHGRFTERPDVYDERLRLYPSGCFVFEQAGEITGYLVSHPWHRGCPPALNALLGGIPDTVDSYYLHDIALLQKARGGGAGAAAVALVLDRAAAAGLETVTLTAINGADSFWATQGFAYVDDDAVKAKLGSYGSDSYLMERRL